MSGGEIISEPSSSNTLPEVTTLINEPTTSACTIGKESTTGDEDSNIAKNRISEEIIAAATTTEAIDTIEAPTTRTEAGVSPPSVEASIFSYFDKRYAIIRGISVVVWKYCKS